MKKHLAALTFLTGLMILVASCNQNLSTTTPENVGLSSDTLALAVQKMQEFIDNGKLAGIATLVMKDGKVVHREQYGYANIEEQKPIEENSIVRIFSMTKPITAVALMTLYDECKFELDHELSRYIPGFKDVMVYQTDARRSLLCLYV